jgi:quinoprotein glucose dehydrogenase
MSVSRLVFTFVCVTLLGSATIAQTSADWPTFGGDAGGGQYSALEQVSAANVGRLKLAWTHNSGDKAWLQATPIHANNSLYYCTPMNRVIALDPVTGKERWRFDPHKDDGGEGLIDQPRQTVRCRSVAYWEAPEPRAGIPCEKRVFKGDINGNVYAIDADTGKSCRDFGASAGHPGYASHWDFEGNGVGPRHTTSGPIVIDDIVVAAVGVEDSPVDASDGFVRAFDVRSGELRWEFNPIPPEHVHETGAANVWSTLSADLERGLVFLPTTSPSSDFFGGTRKFKIPYATATVALAAKTGEPVWHYQVVHHDIYDYDLPGHPLLVTIKKDGEAREVAIQQTKAGYLFVFDRDDGEPVFPIEERPVPASDVPGEQASATQPFPLLPEPFARTMLSRDDMFGMTILGRSWCQKRFDELRYEGMFTPPSEGGTLHFPGFGGGGNWGGAAFDPNSNLLVIKSMTIGTQHWLIPNEGGAITPMPADGDAEVPGSSYRDGTGDPMPGTRYSTKTENFEAPSGVPCTPPPWGTLTAIDMDSGKVKWQRPFGQSRRYGVTFPESWGSAIIGGPIVTAGGIVVMGASMDKKLRILDINTGAELWQDKLPYAGMAVPMTYMANGKQYIVIAAGGNRRAFTEEGDAIVAYTLSDE